MKFQGNSEEMIDPNRTFVTSDHHFCDWKNAPFHESTEEEEAQHIALWNSVVGKDDLVLYVGDFCDGGVVDLEYLSHKLNGRKILIKGNHDDLDDDWYRQVFEDVVTEMRIAELNILLNHEPIRTKLRPGERLIYGHEHRCYYPPSTMRDSICVCAKWHDWKPISLAEAIRQMNAAGNESDVVGVWLDGLYTSSMLMWSAMYI